MIPVYAEKGIPFATKDRAVSLHGKRDLPANRQVDQDSFSSSSADTLNNAVVGISGAQGMILDYILVESVNHPIYQKDVEKEFGLRPSTATGVLNELEQKGMIRREADPGDGRRKKIVFTRQAQAINQKLKSQILESEELLLKGISEEERRIFMDISARMLENLDQDIEASKTKEKKAENGR